MSMPAQKQSADREWVVTTATIESCELSFSSKWRGFRASYEIDQPQPLPEYIVAFSYEAAGKTCGGRYRAGSPQKIGSHFQISYDPNRVTRNTMNDSSLSWTFRLVIGGLVFIAFWLFDHFHKH